MPTLLMWYRRESGTPEIEATEDPEGPQARSVRMKEWRRLLWALHENRSELSHLNTHKATLETMLHQMEELLQIQATLMAVRMEGTQRLTVLMSDCGRLATVLRFALKQHYGLSSEKLEEFGIQPRPPRPADPLG